MNKRSLVRTLLTPLLGVAAVLSLAGTASAQSVSNWLGGGVNGNWSTSGNWDVIPSQANGVETVLVFSGSPQINSIMDTPSPLTVSHIQTAAGSTALYSITGGQLVFSGANSDAGTYPTGILNQGTGGIRINSNLAINTPIEIRPDINNPTGAEIFLGAGMTNQLTGSGNISVFQGTAIAGTLLIQSRNNVNYTGNVAVNNITSVMLAAPNALFRTNAITLLSSGNSLLFAGNTSASGLPQSGFNQQLGNVSGAGQLLVGDALPATVLSGYLGGNVAMNGSATLTGTNTASHFGKVGGGTLQLRSSNNAYSASISVRQGTILIETSGTGIGSQAGSSVTYATVYGGTQLRLNNANVTGGVPAQGRLGDLFDIRLSGGTFRLDGSPTASASNIEFVRNLVPYAGLGVVAVNANAAQFARLDFAAFDATTLSRGGQIGFAGPSLGAGTAAGQSGVTFTDATAVNASAIGGILPWSLAQTTYATAPGAAGVTFLPDTFATVGANGITPLTAFDANNNILTSGATALPATINSLVIGNVGAVTSNATTVTSGAILSRAVGIIDGTGITSTNRGYFSAGTTGSLTITAPVTLPGLSTSGTVSLSSLTLTGTNPTLQVNSGTTTLTAAVAGSPVYVVTKGALLAVPTGLTVNGSGGTLRGNGTVVGNVTVAAGGLIGGTSNGGDNTGGQSPGTLTVNGALTLQGGSNVRFYINSVFGDTAGSTTNGEFTQAKIIATSLDLTSATSGNPITIQPWSLDLKNSAGNAPIYDFNNTETYSWVLGTFSGGITGFSSDKFTVNTAFQNFATNNPLGAGSFTVGQVGNDLVLNFGTPIPEPTLLGFAAIGLAFVARRRMKA
ncbi:hypothetical protein BH11PLA2_BH11PLA2_05780 [soil metagenome]